MIRINPGRLLYEVPDLNPGRPLVIVYPSILFGTHLARKSLMYRYIALIVLFALLAPYGHPLAQTRAAEPSLRPGDVVRVQIWREEDLSGEFPVDETGTVTLPLLGRTEVTGIPLQRLRDVLIEEYRVHLVNPSIQITPLRRVNVLGEVQQPGLYPVDPTMSLVEAIAIAGGTTPLGDLGRIRILRNGATIRHQVAAGETLQALEVLSGDQIIVDRRSWLERNSGLFVSSALSILSGVVTAVLIVRSDRN